MNELKPCPFCGGEARRIDIDATKPSVPDAGASYIACGRCYACSPIMFGEKTGLEESWNRRAISTIGPDAQRNIKELRDLLDLQHTRTMEADKLWQKANGKDRLPVLGELIEWLMKRSDPDAIRRECAALGKAEWFRDTKTITWSRIERAILGTEPAQEES